jgi:hypothetical protein
MRGILSGSYSRPVKGRQPYPFAGHRGGLGSCARKLMLKARERLKMEVGCSHGPSGSIYSRPVLVSNFLRARTNSNPTRKSSGDEELQSTATSTTSPHSKHSVNANRKYGIDNPECAMLRQEKDRYVAMLVVPEQRETDIIMNSYCRRPLQGTNNDEESWRVGY